MTATPANRRGVILDAAAALFADEGVDAVSIRAINRAAGLSPAAVHYHFGTKERLIEAVLQWDGATVGPRIEELADSLLSRPQPPTAAELVRVLATPYLELLQRAPVRGARWLRIVGQLSMAGDRRMVDSVLRPKLISLARRAFPEPPQRELLETWSLAATTLINMLGQEPVTRGGQAQRLCSFVASGLAGTLHQAHGERTFGR